MSGWPIDIISVILLALAIVMLVRAARTEVWAMFLTYCTCSVALAVAVLAVNHL